MPLWKKTWVAVSNFVLIAAVLGALGGAFFGFMWLSITYGTPLLFFGSLFLLLCAMLTKKMIRECDLFNPDRKDF